MDPRIAARRHGVQSRRRFWLWISLGIVVVLTAAAFGVTQSPLLDVDEIEVTGATRTGTDEVLNAAGLEPGAALWRLDLTKARKAIAALPWVREVSSSRSWGGTVVFTVTEREAVAQIPVNEEWVVVDIQGRVLEVARLSPSLPVVLHSPVPEPGGWLSGTALPLLEVSEALIPWLNSDIGAVSLKDGRVVVDLIPEGQAYWGGRDKPESKANALATVLDSVDLDCLLEINLSVPERPVLTRQDECP